MHNLSSLETFAYCTKQLCVPYESILQLLTHGLLNEKLSFANSVDFDQPASVEAG